VIPIELGSRIKKETPGRDEHESGDNSVSVSDLFNQSTARYRSYPVGREKTSLDESCLDEIEVKSFFKKRKKDVVQAGDEANHEEKN
jgi:hypothetical protein